MTTRKAGKKPMGRPPKPDDERLDVIAVRVNAVLAGRLADAAAQLGVGKTTAARMLIEEALAARARKGRKS